MIARTWSGTVPSEKAADYLELMRRVALPEYRATPGNRGAWCLHRVTGDIAEFEMLSFWDSLDAIKTFAGADVEAARYFDFDSDFLVAKAPTARHFKITQ